MYTAHGTNQHKTNKEKIHLQKEFKDISSWNRRHKVKCFTFVFVPANIYNISYIMRDVPLL